jgi:hypothetical protein
MIPIKRNVIAVWGNRRKELYASGRCLKGKKSSRN